MILYYTIGINYYTVFNYLKLIDLLIDFPGCITFIWLFNKSYFDNVYFFYSSNIISLCNVCAYNIDLNKTTMGFADLYLKV